VSALLLSDALHAIWTANQPMRRWTTPYAISPARATNSSDALSPPCLALALAFLALALGGIAGNTLRRRV
jgi:hypothetical protein